jgi:hypothetical protein
VKNLDQTPNGSPAFRSAGEENENFMKPNKKILEKMGTKCQKKWDRGTGQGIWCFAVCLGLALRLGPCVYFL